MMDAIVCLDFKIQEEKFVNWEKTLNMKLYTIEYFEKYLNSYVTINLKLDVSKSIIYCFQHNFIKVLT